MPFQLGKKYQHIHREQHEFVGTLFFMGLKVLPGEESYTKQSERCEGQRTALTLQPW